MYLKPAPFLLLLMAVFACSCGQGGKDASSRHGRVIKGLYSFGPEVKSFKDCNTGSEYWVADSSAKLELEYSNMNFEKPYEPVYVEVEGEKVRSGKDGMGSEYDSTLVVRKLIKITRDIPEGMCD